jgi:hypothetical protein
MAVASSKFWCSGRAMVISDKQSVQRGSAILVTCNYVNMVI